MDTIKLNGLMRLIEATDIRNTDICSLFQNMRPILEQISEMIGIAKLEIGFKVEPDEYDMQGYEENLSACFGGEADPGGALTLEFEEFGNSAASMTVFPASGKSWSVEDKEYIEALMKLIYTAFSRANTIRRQDKAPYIDSLTGLANNVGIEYYWTRISRGRPMGNFAAVFINLRGFRLLNVRFGTVVADEIMKQYSYALYRELEMGRELIARLGGDNFFIILKKEKLDEFIEKAKLVEIPVDRGDRIRNVRVHGWIGVYPATDEDDLSGLLSKSSFAADQSKKKRNPVTYFEQSEMDYSVHEEMLSRRLPRALARGEFVPFYQPKVDLESGELYGCEALVRWFHRDKLISPAEFIPIAERNGFITNIDLYMLDKVCSDIRGWIDSGIEPVCVSINYSQRDFYSSTLIEDTLRIIDNYRIDSKYIEIEITETSYIENAAALSEFVDRMHDHGIRVSLDDFGTGYSSINMFKTLDLDTIKLDRSLFDEAGLRDGKSRLILHGISDMINQLHSTSISEGIETEEQLKLVHEIGGRIIQGFIFDRPLEKEEFTKRLITRRYDKKLD